MQVTFIGAGAMASAIAGGAASANPEKWSFTVYDLNVQAAEQLAATVGGYAAPTLDEALAAAEMVVLAVKPQVQAQVLRELPPLPGATFVSIAAGRTLRSMEEDLTYPGRQKSPAIVRVMPNVNALVGRAISAVCHNERVTDRQLQAARALFDTVGETMLLDEHLFGAFTAMAGSSPAWFFQIVEDLARAGVAHGLTKQEATRAACASMLGSATMLQKHLEEGGVPSQLVDQVCSPGGTTVAGLLAAQNRGLAPALVDAVNATIRREKELG